MKSEIFIICNSSACLDELSSGRYPDFNRRNIVTCNRSFNFFRTSGRHFNFVSDWEEVDQQYKNPHHLMPEVGYKPIEFIYAKWDQLHRFKRVIYPNMNYSPVVVGATSGLNALFYLNAAEDFDNIILLGYTANEWQGIKMYPNLAEKKKEFDKVLRRYRMERTRPFVYTFSKR